MQTSACQLRKFIFRIGSEYIICNHATITFKTEIIYIVYFSTDTKKAKYMLQYNVNNMTINSH